MEKTVTQAKYVHDKTMTEEMGLSVARCARVVINNKNEKMTVAIKCLSVLLLAAALVICTVDSVLGRKSAKRFQNQSSKRKYKHVLQMQLYASVKTGFLCCLTKRESVWVFFFAVFFNF